MDFSTGLLKSFDLHGIVLKNELKKKKKRHLDRKHVYILPHKV